MLSTSLLSNLDQTQRKVLIATTVGAVVLANVVQRWWRRYRKRRHLSARISKFLLAERERRDEIRSRKEIGAKYQSILALPLPELARKLRQGELKAVDVLHVYQKAALESTDQTNAVTEFVLERAERMAAELDKVPLKDRKALHGVPISVKECFFLPTTETTAGFSTALGNFVSFEPGPLVQFLESLGCVPFVKSNIPQSMLTFDSRNPIYGITRNPFNLSRGPGGSSSGEGALVGGKVSILGVGSDIGGSLRIPAAWSGCYTIKTTSTRMLQGGAFPSAFTPRVLLSNFHSGGLMTQDVDSLILVHRLMYSNETFKQFSFSTLVPLPFREEFLYAKSLTIGYGDFDGVIETVPSMKRAIKIAKEALEKRGHKLVPWKAPRAKDSLMLYFQTMSIDGVKETIQALDDDIEVSYPNKLSFTAMRTPYWIKCLVASIARRFVGDLAVEVTKNLKFGTEPHDMNLQFRRVKAYREEFAKAFQQSGLDALLWPSFPCPAPLLDAPRDILASISYTGLFNLLDWPAGVCPVTKVELDDEIMMISYPGDRDMFHRAIKESNVSDTVGLPVSVQVAAPQYCEEIVFRLMSDIAASAKL